MDLNAQIQALIDGAPKDGRTPEVVSTIAPVLRAFAEQLQRTDYYVLQTLNGDWVKTTLSSRTEQGVEKNIIYAFATLEDAGKSPLPVRDPQIIALPIPVTHILFQLIALTTLDSLVFFNQPGNVSQGTEVTRSSFEASVQDYLQRFQNWQTGEEIPSDLA